MVMEIEDSERDHRDERGAYSLNSAREGFAD